MNRIHTIALAGVLAAASAFGAEMAKVTFRVTNLDSKPIERASVIVRFVRGRSTVKLGKKMRTEWETRTNQEGTVSIPEIPQGQIRVQVIAKGYQTFGNTVDIDAAEKTVEIQLKPPQPQYSAH